MGNFWAIFLSLTERLIIMGMLLYICPDCGKWQDASAMEYLGNLVINLGNALQGKQVPDQQQKEPLAVACPGGCGLMTQVKPEDKLLVQSVKPS